MSDLFPHQSSLARVAESLIFAAEEPVSAATIADIYSEATGEDTIELSDVEETIEVLNAFYQETGRTFRIEFWSGGYRMATVEEVASYIRALLENEKERKLSRSLMETLAVVAYRQPVSKPEIDHIRGVNADYALRRLLELRFIAVVGRDDSVGRPLVYGTTDQFLEQFGIGKLEDLPRPREIEELLEDPAFTRERAELLSSLEEPELPDPQPADDGPEA